MDPAQRYEVVTTIAAGDFATVYRARDRELGREVAVKQIHPQFLSDPRQLERYWHEAQLLASLQHPNILTIYDIVRPRGWLILELMRGSLQPYTQAAPIDLDFLRRVLAGSLQALHFLHTNGILHGDIKPSNLLLDPQNRIKVGDFGLACRASSAEGSLLKGTTKYMAPELISPQMGARGPASDLYSLGFSAYELMCGGQFESLFPGLASFGRDRQVAWLMWHSAPDRHLPEIPRVLEGVPPDLAYAIQGMVIKDPARRFQSAQDVLRVLRPAAGGPIAPPVANAAAAAPAPTNRVRRIGVIAAFCCSMLMSLMMLFWNPVKPPPKAPPKGPEPTRGVVRELDLGNRLLVLERTDTGKPEEISLKPRDEVVVNDKKSLPRDLQPGDRVTVERFRDDENRPFMRITAIRAETSAGRVLEIKPAENKLIVEVAAGSPPLEVRMAKSLEILFNGKETYDGKPVTLAELKPDDRVTISHIAGPHGRTALELSVLRHVTTEGTLRDLDLPKGRLTIATGDEGSPVLVKLPLAAEVSVTVNDRTELGGRLLKIRDLKPGDRVKLTHDTQVVRIDAYRVLGNVGVVQAVHPEAGTLEVLVDGQERPTGFLVGEKCKVTLVGEKSTLGELRNGDHVEISHDSPGAKNPEALSITATRPAVKTRWAVLVGIQGYDDGTLPRLDYPADDAKRLRDVLVARYAVPAEHALLLTDASQVRLQQAIPDLLGQVEADNELLVYFAGHAIPDKDGTIYLAPANFNASQVAASGVKLAWLIDEIEKCPAKQKLLLLDTARGPKTGKRPGESPSALEMLQTLRDADGVLPLKTMVVVAACSPLERSADWKAKHQGLFAECLAEAYSGSADLNRDNRIEVSELFTTLGKSMAAATAEAGVRQTAALVAPDEKKARLTAKAKEAIRRLAGLLGEDRFDATAVGLLYQAAEKEAPKEPEQTLIYGLLLMKARDRVTAARQFSDLNLARPELVLPLRGLAWLEFEKRSYTAGVEGLKRVVAAISRPKEPDREPPESVLSLFAWIGQLREFASAAVDEGQRPPADSLEALDAAVTDFGGDGAMQYHKGRDATRKIVDQFDAQIRGTSDESKRSQLRVTRKQLSRYATFPYSEAAKEVLAGMEEGKK